MTSAFSSTSTWLVSFLSIFTDTRFFLIVGSRVTVVLSFELCFFLLICCYSGINCLTLWFVLSNLSLTKLAFIVTNVVIDILAQVIKLVVVLQLVHPLLNDVSLLSGVFEELEPVGIVFVLALLKCEIELVHRLSQVGRVHVLFVASMMLSIFLEVLTVDLLPL